MKSSKYMDESVLIEKAIKAIIQKVGPIEAIRFINMIRPNRIESVKRHRIWQKGLDKDKFFNEVFTDSTISGI